MQIFRNISNHQTLTFGNTEKGHYFCSQSIDKQYLYSSSFSSSFTGKEKDPETGYSYFGARYLDHELMTMWLSVDPMADKYPSISPYAYCAWNPLKLVDPEGKDWYDLYDDGTLIRNEEKSKEYKKYDVIYSVSKKKLSDMMSLGTMSEQTKEEKNGYKGSKMSLYGNREDNVIAFKFCADNSRVEFSLIEIEHDGVKYTSLTTSHDIRSIDKPSTDNYGSEYAKENSIYLVSHLHNHIGSASPSVFYNDSGEMCGDLAFRDAIIKRRNTIEEPLPNVLFGIYKCTGNDRYTKDYDGNLIDPVTMKPL